MTQRDQELLAKQLRCINRSPADGFLALSLFTTILFCVLLVGTTIG
jgi:hypothetical protein